MSQDLEKLKEEILHLYREPVIASGYGNTYGEENLVNLVSKYRTLDEDGMALMSDLLVDYSTSHDLTASYISVAVMHALNMHDQVDMAYAWARNQDDAQNISSHFDIGKSLADHFIG